MAGCSTNELRRPPESSTDVAGSCHRNAAPRGLPERVFLNGANLKVENILPQRVIAGLYHAGESGWFATLDLLWMEFSKFATGSVSLNGTDLDVDNSKRTLALDRMWGVGAGVSVERSNAHEVDVFLNVVNYGDAAVDTGRVWYAVAS